MRLSFANAFRAFVLLLLAAHVFYMYCLARTNAETFGFDLGTTIIALLFALAMLVPLVWAVTLPELPEIYTNHWRARRWWKQHRCSVCGYRTDWLKAQICPECGQAIIQPSGYRINKHTIKLFIMLNVSAWMTGCVAGEFWLQLDEVNFQREVSICRRVGETSCRREAAWPSPADLQWNGQAGFSKNYTKSMSFGKPRSHE